MADRRISDEGFDKLAAQALDPDMGGATQKTRRTGEGPAPGVPEAPSSSFVIGLPQFGQNDVHPTELTGQKISEYESANAAELSPGNRYLGLWNTGEHIAMDVSQSEPATREGLETAHGIATSGERPEDAIGYFDNTASYDQTISLRDVDSMVDVSWQAKYQDQPNLTPPPGAPPGGMPVPDPARRREALTGAVTPSFNGSWKALASKGVENMPLEDVSQFSAQMMNGQRHAAFQTGMGQVESRQSGVIDSPGDDSTGSALAGE